MENPLRWRGAEAKQGGVVSHKYEFREDCALGMTGLTYSISIANPEKPAIPSFRLSPEGDARKNL